MKKIMTAVLLSALAAGCATPEIRMKHEETGNIAKCGGEITGSLVGGMAGHTWQKDEDQKCVTRYEALGYKRVN